MKVIIAGGRDFRNSDLMYNSIMELIEEGFIDKNSELVSGLSNGADTEGLYLWKKEFPNNKIYRFPANWRIHGKIAGILRNKKMGDFSDSLIAFWDGESKGTKNMIEIMDKLNKPFKIIK